MVLFPYCKINIGLDILYRRADGFHEIETAMFPVHGLCDIVEMVKQEGLGIEFTTSGLAVDCPADKNLCVKAYKLMASRFGIGGVRMHLHKIIPFGAGLGGGSADAAFTIRGLNQLFGLGLDTAAMESLAAELGSDTAFFIRDTPQLAQGRGEKLTPLAMSLSGKTLVIVKPSGINISTAEAYSGVHPLTQNLQLAERLAGGIATWKDCIVNGFEENIFEAHPELADIKGKLYSLGAIYASMSGSGSALYGIFDGQHPHMSSEFPNAFVYQEIIAHH